MRIEKPKTTSGIPRIAAKQVILMILLASVLVPATSGARDVYQPGKVVYDVSVSGASGVAHILDRISLLQRLYENDPFESSIIVVLHDGAIPLFAKSSKKYSPELTQRARSLVLGEVIQFRLCAASSKMQGFDQKDFDSFISVIPMADAEIIQLQQKGFAYLR